MMLTAKQATGSDRETDPAGCCSGFYEQDWVRAIAEDNFHPGGAELTRKAVNVMNLPDGAHIADLGCGTGTTAIMLAHDYNLNVSAVDRSLANISRACERANQPQPLKSVPPNRTDASTSKTTQIQFIPADAASLPFDDQSLDGVLAECAFSLFPDKPAVLSEIHRILRPGGQAGITDMAIGGTLPDDIKEVIAPWTCLTDALDATSYRRLFRSAGFTIIDEADESGSLEALIGNLKRKMLMLGAGSMLAGSAVPALDLGTIRGWMDRFSSEVESGVIQYLRFNLLKS
jgi:arsenite methyltransferase